MNETGKRIKECRLSKQLTQADVAKHLGIGKQAVYKYETGAVTNIPLENIEKMATLFNVAPEYLSGWSTEAPSPASPSVPETTLSPDETVLVSGYRELPPPGKEYLLQQLTVAKLLHGEKSSSSAIPDAG